MKVFKKNAAFFWVMAAFGLAALPTAAQTGVPQQETLLNGMKVLMWTDPKADTVSVRVRVHSGSAFDPQGKEGLMQLLADSLFPNEAAREFFAEDLGGSLKVTTTYDYIEVAASAKPANFLTMLETVSTAVSNPQIDKEMTAKLKSALIRRLDGLANDPSYLADTAIARRLFGTFPYGRPSIGTKDSVSRIDFADLIDARQRFLTADNASIGVTGNYDKTLGFRAIRRYFGSWLKSDRRIPSTFKQPDDPAAQPLNIPSPQTETLYRFALRGAARGDKELASSLIFASVLESRLRLRLGATNSVFVRNEPHVLPGSIVVGFSAQDNGIVIGNEGPANIVSKAIAEPVTNAEFSMAKQAVQLEWNKKDVLEFWLDADTFKIANKQADIRAIESVTLADVLSYAERVRVRPVASVVLNASRPTD
jgi:predicted Zn-dependent peptidase